MKPFWNTLSTLWANIGAFLHCHRLMVLRVERRTMRINGFQLEALEGVEEQQRQLHALTHRP